MFVSATAIPCASLRGVRWEEERKEGEIRFRRKKKRGIRDREGDRKDKGKVREGEWKMKEKKK